MIIFFMSPFFRRFLFKYVFFIFNEPGEFFLEFIFIIYTTDVKILNIIRFSQPNKKYYDNMMLKWNH